VITDARLSRNVFLKWSLFVHFGGHVQDGGSRGGHESAAQVAAYYHVLISVAEMTTPHIR
jgi:hypothetical protein